MFQTAIISLLQVWLEKLHCTPFHKVGIACASFVLGMKPSVVQYFGLSRTNALLALILLFSHLGRNKKVAVGSLLHTADRRECCLSIPDARLAMSTWSGSHVPVFTVGRGPLTSNVSYVSGDRCRRMSNALQACSCSFYGICFSGSSVCMRALWWIGHMWLGKTYVLAPNRYVYRPGAGYWVH